MSSQYGELGPLAAEICWRVWGTPANFNGFHVLTALLHGTVVAGVSQTLRRDTRNGITELSQRAPPIFGRAAIMLGIGPHSSCVCYCCIECRIYLQWYIANIEVGRPMQQGNGADTSRPQYTPTCLESSDCSRLSQ